MRLFKLALLLCFLFLQHQLWWGKNSLNDYVSLRDEVENLRMDNDELQLRNKLAGADIDDLRSGLEAIEELARNELGLIKQNETFYRIVTPEHE